MAAKSSTIQTKIKRARKKRPGIHAKNKSRKLKSSKNYIKLYKAQGK